MENMKKNVLNLDMFNGVNSFVGIDRDNLVVEGERGAYVPSEVKQLWFRSVYPKGMVKTQMLGTMEEAARYKYCVFNAEIYDSDGKLLAMGHGSASTDEEYFIEVAERRAVGKALASAGFTWHNGDFSYDIDVANSHLNLYNSYINSGTLDISDQKVKQMYEDALVTVLPESYGADSGKPIAAMDELRLAEIAQNYGVINNGDPLVNAQIKFVYMYKLIEQESEKKPETDPTAKDKAAEPKKGRKGGKRGKKESTTTVADEVTESKTEDVPTEMSETSDVVNAVPAENVAVEKNEDAAQMAEPETIEQPKGETISAQETAEETKVFPLFPSDGSDAEDTAVEEEFADEGQSEQFTMDAEPEFSEDPFTDMDGDIDVEKMTDGDVFEGFTFDDTENNPFHEDDDSDIQKDINKYMILQEWGYDAEEAITSDWAAHMKKIKEKSRELNYQNEDEVKAFIESVPICGGFLWQEKMHQDEVVILGDFLKENKEAVIDIINNGIQIPVKMVRPLMEWYVTHVWGEF